jgi:signal transduction histidine kinase
LKEELNILLIEDNESDAALCLRHLQKSGLKVKLERVETAKELKNALETKNWDLIISDYQLPTLNAPMAIQIYKSYKMDIPFIVLSGEIGEEEAVALIKKGAHDYITKQNISKLPLVVKRELADFSSRKELARIHEDLIISNAALESSLRTKDEFLILASHELKTPLTSLKLRIQYLEKKLQEENKATIEIEFFDRQVDRIIKVIEDMLDVTRIQAGSLPLELTNVNFNDLVDKVLDHFSAHLKNSKCQVNVKMDHMIVGHWDQTRLLQVLINIVDNVIKYAPGSILTIIAQQNYETTDIIISDTGPGIPKAKQALIFNRFERLGLDTNISGLGLGLYICKNVIEALGGTIELKGNTDIGTAFLIHLPNNIVTEEFKMSEQLGSY